LLADAGVLFAVVGQPIGRIGNIINGDILGDPSNLPWATAYTYVTSGAGFTSRCAVLQPGFQCNVGYQPAAAYEAIGTIVIGLVLFALLRRGVRDGAMTITYVALYAVSQIVIFHWRASEPTVLAGLKQAQWTAIGILAVGVPLLVALHRRFPPRKAPAAGADDSQAAIPQPPPEGAMA
jgi:phosphatidylglycerol:prolipoprotein diacylglycerol transferase